MVAEAWSSVSSDGNPFVVLDTKLRAMAKKLQSWSDRWIGNVKIQIAIALEIIKQLDIAMEGRALSPAELGLRKVLKRKLLGLCSLERSIARQRSWMLWLREGDATTGFFFQHANHRRRRNVIMGLWVDGDILTGQEEIAGAVDSYFQRILGEAPARDFRLNLEALQLPHLTLDHLEIPFTEEEVFKAVKAMPLDKAPGPDGFTTRFYACCWDIIKTDFMRAMDCFFRGDMRGLHTINKALVTLLPKVDGADDLKDLRPVSLVHGAVKIFDKVLSLRLIAR